MKDINTLIKLSRKLGESICDQGTYEERQSKHLIMTSEWKRNVDKERNEYKQGQQKKDE